MSNRHLHYPPVVRNFYDTAHCRAISLFCVSRRTLNGCLSNLHIHGGIFFQRRHSLTPSLWQKDFGSSSSCEVISECDPKRRMKKSVNQEDKEQVCGVSLIAGAVNYQKERLDFPMASIDQSILILDKAEARKIPIAIFLHTPQHNVISKYLNFLFL